MIERGYVRVGAGQIHIRSVAGQGLPLVMLHQTASSGAMFEAAMTRLAGSRPLLALDTPGFGGSFEPAAPPDLPQYGRWVLDALNALGLDRVHLLGHHTGGCIAVEVAAKASHRVESLSVIGPVYLGAAERERYRMNYSRPIAPSDDGSYLLETWNVLGSLGGGAALRLRHREMVDYLRAWKARGDAYDAVWESDQPVLYRDITCPMLIGCAPDDVLMPSFEVMRDVLTGARFVELDGANFELDLDVDGCAAAIGAFLADVEAGLRATAVTAGTA